MHCGSCSFLWDCVQNKCTRRRPQKWYSTAGWRHYFGHFSPQTAPVLDIWRHLALRPLTVSQSHTPESSRKQSRIGKRSALKRKWDSSYHLVAAVVIELPPEVKVSNANAAGVGAGQHHRAAIHCLQIVDLPYRHLKGLSGPQTWTGRDGDKRMRARL